MSTNVKSSATSVKPVFEKNVLYAAKGSGIIAFGRLFEYFSRFIIAFFIARLLGADQLGMYSLALSVATLVATISIFGLDDTILRFTAIFSSRHDEAGLWGTIQFCIGLVALLSLLSGAGVFFLAEPIAKYFFRSSQGLAPLLRFAGLLVPFLALGELLKYVTRGFKKMEYSVIAENFIQVPFRLVLIGVFSIFRLNAYLVIIAYGISDLAASIILVYFLNKEFSLRRPLNTARYDVRDFLNYSFPLWISDMLSKFRGNLQTLLLGSLSSVSSVGIFTVVERIYTIGHISYASILTSSKPLLAELQAKEEWRQLERIYQTTTRWAVTLNLPVFLSLVLFPTQMLSILGKSYISGALALQVLACGELVNVGTGLCGSVIDMTGHTRLKLFNSGVQIVVSLGLNFLLIPRWGVLGAGVAAFTSIATVNVLRVAEVWILYRLLPYNIELVKPAVAGITAFATYKMLVWLIPIPETFVYTVIQILLVFLVFLGMLWILGLSQEDHAVLASIRQKTNALLSKNRAVQKM